MTSNDEPDEEDPHITEGPDAEKEDPHGARIESLGDQHTAAWDQTLDDMEILADGRREDGWEAHTAIAAHTDTVTKDMPGHDRFGLQHIVPNNHADIFEDVYDEDEFTEYLAYGQRVEWYMFLVTEFIDPDNKRSIFVASSFDMAMETGIIDNAREEGVLNSYFKTIDGDILGQFVHEEWEPLLEGFLDQAD